MVLPAPLIVTDGLPLKSYAKVLLLSDITNTRDMLYNIFWQFNIL